MLARLVIYARAHRRQTIGFFVVFVMGMLWAAKGSKGKMKFAEATVERLPSFADVAHCIARPRPMAETYLSVQHGGRLEEVYLKPGSPVKAGEIIAIVDRTANAAALKSALSAFRLASSDYGRSSNLLRRGAATREETESNRSKLDVKRAELEQAKQRVEDSVIRAPMDGVVSVVVFKLGDKVPDGGRVAAVEDPHGTQASCRLPVEVATQLGHEQTTTWTLVDGKAPTAFTVSAKVTVEDPQGGFTGLDREVKIETTDLSVRVAVGMLTDITLQLPSHTNVAKLPSLAVVRRDGGSFILQKDDHGDFRWQKISVIKQSAQETFAEGVPADGKTLILTDDLSKIETYVKPLLAKSQETHLQETESKSLQ